MKKTIILIFALLFISVSFASGQTLLIPAGDGGYIDSSTGTYYSNDGCGGAVNSRDGTYMAPTGIDNGFVNTRDGSFVPIVPMHDYNDNSDYNNDDGNDYND